MSGKIQKESKESINARRNVYSLNGDTAYLTITRKDGSKHTVEFDADDLGRVQRNGPYSLVVGNGGPYVGNKSNRCVTRMLHRLIMETPEGLECDVLDGNGLNCRKANLRNGEGWQVNKTNKRATLRSNYKGVVWVEYLSKWRAYVYDPDTQKSRYAGSYNSVLEAVAGREAWIAENMPRKAV